MISFSKYSRKLLSALFLCILAGMISLPVSAARNTTDTDSVWFRPSQEDSSSANEDTSTQSRGFFSSESNNRSNSSTRTSRLRAETIQSFIPNSRPSIDITGYSVRNSKYCNVLPRVDCRTSIGYRVTNSNPDEKVTFEIHADCADRSRRLTRRTRSFKNSSVYEGTATLRPREAGTCIIRAEAYYKDYENRKSSDVTSFIVLPSEKSSRSSPTRRAPRTVDVERPFCAIREAFGDRDCRNRSESVPLPRTGSDESILINFGPSNAGFEEYIQETGLAFQDRGNGLRFGWNQDNTANTKKRNSQYSPDNRFDSVGHFQWRGNKNAYWEIEIPNGQYKVEVGVGDPNYAPNDRYDADTYHDIEAEGRRVERCRPSEKKHWCRGSRNITVKDGKLTLSPGSKGNNTKINYVIITPRD